MVVATSDKITPPDTALIRSETGALAQVKARRKGKDKNGEWIYGEKRLEVKANSRESLAAGLKLAYEKMSSSSVDAGRDWGKSGSWDNTGDTWERNSAHNWQETDRSWGTFRNTDDTENTNGTWGAKNTWDTNDSWGSPWHPDDTARDTWGTKGTWNARESWGQTWDTDDNARDCGGTKNTWYAKDSCGSTPWDTDDTARDTSRDTWSSWNTPDHKKWYNNDTWEIEESDDTKNTPCTPCDAHDTWTTNGNLQVPEDSMHSGSAWEQWEEYQESNIDVEPVYSESEPEAEASPPPPTVVPTKVAHPCFQCSVCRKLFNVSGEFLASPLLRGEDFAPFCEGCMVWEPCDEPDVEYEDAEPVQPTEPQPQPASPPAEPAPSHPLAVLDFGAWANTSSHLGGLYMNPSTFQNQYGRQGCRQPIYGKIQKIFVPGPCFLIYGKYIFLVPFKRLGFEPWEKSR